MTTEPEQPRTLGQLLTLAEEAYQQAYAAEAQICEIIARYEEGLEDLRAARSKLRSIGKHD
jgi:hypothetical protein